MSDELRTVHGDQGEQLREGLATGLDKLMSVSADRVFSEPVRVGETVVIPAAAIMFGGGFGFGGDKSSNGGGGGGGWNDGRPVAVIEAGPAGVHVRPIVDVTKIGVTLVAATLTVWRATRR
ncbi:MAG TPA: sporulation protein [Acidimicrobiia bacterium]|nr:sporulation protein [Acidimicrobiia bacterium]